MNSQAENITFVQQLYAAFGRRDIPAIMDVLSTEVEWGEPANPFNPAGGLGMGRPAF